MTAVGIEVSTRCKGCGHVVAVNAMVPLLACPTCDRRLGMDATRWQLLLEEPLREGPGMALHTEQAAPFQTEDGVFQRVYRRVDPCCSRCGAELGPDRLAAMAARGAGFCSGCAAPVALRPAFEPLSRHGVVALVGEDVSQIAGPDAPPAHEPVPLACANCGGSLRVDGRQRLVNCQYCGFNQYLPDDLWKQFHPQKPVVRWFLVWSGAPARAATAARAAWEHLGDVVTDDRGNLYCSGSTAGNDFAVWSMAPDLSMRWHRAGLKLDSSDAQLAWAPSGHLLLWQPDKRTVLVLACSDGSTATQLSGKPGEGHALEMKECEGIVCDRDGTLLQIASGHRLLRYGPFGEPVATWGAGPREPRPLEDEDSHVVSRMSDRPLFAMAVRLGMGWDGFLYVHGIFSVEELIEIARYDRTGRRHFSAVVKPGGDTWAIARPSADVHGVIHAMVRDDDQLPSVWRFAPDGSRGDRWLASHKVGGLLGNERHMALCLDGSLWLLGDGGAARRFGADGRVHFLSEASRRSDQQALEDDDA